MSPAPITRRAILGAATAAGAGVLPALAAPDPSLGVPMAHPDAALFALLDRYGPLLAESDAADAVADELWDRAEAQAPPRPAAVQWRHDDHFGRATAVPRMLPNGRVALIYDAVSVDDLRDGPEPTRAIEAREPMPGRPDNCIVRMERVPDERRIARRAEIIEAHERWKAECDAIKERLGAFTASQTAGDLADTLADLGRDILDTAPRTLAGLGRKARWASRSGTSKSTAAIWSARVLADAVVLAEQAGEGRA